MVEILHKIGKKEFVLKADFEEILKFLELQKGDWEEGTYTEVWTCEPGNVSKEDYMGDIEELKAIVTKYRDNKDLLITMIEDMPKKANGTFNKRRIKRLASSCYVSQYYTDFTNSWKILTIIIDVISDTECELILRNEYEKN